MRTPSLAIQKHRLVVAVFAVLAPWLLASRALPQVWPSPSPAEFGVPERGEDDDSAPLTGEAFVPDLGWAEIVQVKPDPDVVVDEAARLRIEATGLPWMVREPISGIEFLLVPPGEYLRGMADEEATETFHELLGSPRHAVELTEPFYLGRTEVTRGQWRRVLGATEPGAEADDDRPVVSVSLFDVRAFLTRTNLTLPRDAEWEYACRAGAAVFSPDEIREQAWSGLTLEEGVQPVARKRPNAWGFYDMIGNAWELTGTRFMIYSRYPLGSDPLPAVADDQAWSYHFVMRGSCFAFGVEDLQPWVRLNCPPTKTQPYIGFRVARHLHTQPPQLPEAAELPEGPTPR